MGIERRDLIKILGAGLGAPASGIGQQQHQHGPAGKAAAANYTPRALTASEYRIVDILANLILPADETSPGAHEAGVARYIDIVLLYGDKATLELWKTGLKAVDDAARSAYGRSFSDVTASQQTDILKKMAENEMNPVSPMDTLFVAAKRIAIEAFYLSPVGKQSLGYKGDTAVSRFRGCTEPEHKV